MVAFWGLLIFGIVSLVQSLSGGHPGGRGRSADELLDHRLASGEITPEEYGRRRETLGGSDGGS